MPVESFADPGREVIPAIELTLGARLAMVVLGYLPLIHLLATVAATLLMTFRHGLLPAVGTACAMVYLVPPLATRLARPRKRLTAQRYPIGSRPFLVWWYTAQTQVLFNRLPLLEELLRFVPGFYAFWMRLWGAKIGSLVYWSPGVIIYDRSFVDIGSRVVIGADARIYPHFLARSETGQMELVLAPVRIGHDTLVGGATLLPAGVEIGPGEETPGGRPMAPFAQFKEGRHLRTKRFLKEQLGDCELT